MALFGGVPRASELPDDDVVTVISGRAAADITVLMPLYRQERFVADAVQSVLDQRDIVCEIILSDDASADRTLDLALDVVRRERRTTVHSVRVRRGTRRLRRAHMLALLEYASTPIVAQAHGDDVSLPIRMRELHAALAEETAVLASSPFVTIDESGDEIEPAADVGPGRSSLTLDQTLARPPWLIGAVQAWRPDRLSIFRPLDLDYAPLGHDRILPVRAALLGGARVVGEPLVNRRIHGDNWSRQIVDTSDWRTGKHGWNLARIMVLDVVLEDIARALDVGVVSNDRAEEARISVLALRARYGNELRAQHAALTGRGRRLMWVEEQADG